MHAHLWVPVHRLTSHPPPIIGNPINTLFTNLSSASLDISLVKKFTVSHLSHFHIFIWKDFCSFTWSRFFFRVVSFVQQHLQQFTVTGACAHRRLRTGGSPASARGGVVVVLRRVVGQLVERIPLVSVVGTSKLKSVSQEE